jgi:hypothetical protein
MLQAPGIDLFSACLILVLLVMAYLNAAILVCTLDEKWRARRERIREAKRDAKLFLLAGHRVK